MKRIKRYLLTLLCLTCAFAAGCSKQDAVKTDGDAPTAQETPAAADVDLTGLSTTMLYAEVNNIMTNPENYMGKTIKIVGPYNVSYYDKTGLSYHYVLIEDATACCQQGIEFLWKGDHKYPDDYPQAQTRIEVFGVFGSYEELGQTYYYLAVDDVAILG